MKVKKRYKAKIRQSIYQQYSYYIMEVGDELTVDKIRDGKIDVTFRNIKCFIFNAQIENFELVK